MFPYSFREFAVKLRDGTDLLGIKAIQPTGLQSFKSPLAFTFIM
jgi:hypothetical protein